jgi:hypothetical protein
MLVPAPATILGSRTVAPEKPMNLIARARRYLSTSRRTARRLDDDPADMGTAFGLDAITTIQPESAAETAARERAAPASRIDYRLHRRSTF